ncbi:hypothetical protein MF628_08965 [Paenibacillus polymyxa]|nr:hypothetical protein [Paenibacillus polymyxa]WDZ63736.1 hypothetical protein MF628_08965 [Paenibacillus polymyxa]
MRSNPTEIAKAGGGVAEISRLDMILIDFDGTISPNAVWIIMQSLHDFY